LLTKRKNKKEIYYYIQMCQVLSEFRRETSASFELLGYTTVMLSAEEWAEPRANPEVGS
jgi:hypothetical protein